MPTEARGRVELATYDETLRFNTVFIDGGLCIMQPYLQEARGVDAPTFVIERKPNSPGLFHVFRHAYDSLWERGKPA